MTAISCLLYKISPGIPTDANRPVNGQPLQPTNATDEGNGAWSSFTNYASKIIKKMEGEGEDSGYRWYPDLKLAPRARMNKDFWGQECGPMVSLRLKGLYLYTIAIAIILFHVDWCIRLLALVLFYHNPSTSLA